MTDIVNNKAPLVPCTSVPSLTPNVKYGGSCSGGGNGGDDILGMPKGTFYAVIGAVAGAIVIAAAVAYFKCYRKKEASLDSYQSLHTPLSSHMQVQ
jgi:hypothetical protein